jgi:serine/threonine-protein kinase RIO1
MVLFKMLNRGLLARSTGAFRPAEANGTTPGRGLAGDGDQDLQDESILVFKHRDRYVSGDYRFRRTATARATRDGAGTRWRLGHESDAHTSPRHDTP